MSSAISNGVAAHQPRNQSSGMGSARGSNDRAPGMQPTTISHRLVNSRTSWNSNIWGSSGLGVNVSDTTMDKTHIRGQTSYGSNRDSLMEEKSGSGSLLSTSESEGWAGRDGSPWGARRDQFQAAGQPFRNGSAGVINEQSGTQQSPFFSLPREQNIQFANDSSLLHHVQPNPLVSSGPAVSSSANGRNTTFRREDSNQQQLNATAFMNHIDHTSQTNTGFRLSGGRNLTDNSNNLDFRPLHGASTGNSNFSGARSPEYSSHLPQQSISSLPDRPAHSTQRSFQSEPLIDGHGQVTPQGDLPVDISKLQLYDDAYSTYSQRTSEQRPRYYSHLSQDSLERFKITETPRDGGTAGIRSFTPDATFPDVSRRFQGRSQHPSRMSGSPVSTDYGRNLNGGYYSPSGGVPSPANRVVRLNNQFADRQADLSDVCLQQEQQQQMLGNSSNPLQGRVNYSQGINLAAYPTTGMNPLANVYPIGPVAGLNPAIQRSSQRGQDGSHVYRSPLLEEFRANNKGNRRYELKDIYNHIVEFSGDQHGSRFIQHKLETANSDEKEQVFQEIRPNATQLMKDVFGNYVVQKLFEHGNQAQKKALAQQMMGQMLDLSVQMYGCRVVQKALEYVLTDQQAAMVKELESHVMECVKDQNGNHVIQKAIERVPMEYVQFIVDDFKGQVTRLAAHPYGCRVIQRMLEHCHEEDRQSILAELHANTGNLILDQFGNYVIQHVIQHGAEADRSRVISIVMSQFLMFSKHKFASNVVEKSIEFSSQAQRAEIMHMLLTPNERGESPLLGLMRDQYGNYVIQKILDQTQGPDRGDLVRHIEPLLIQLKKLSYGKQIAAIERLILQPSSVTSSSRRSSSRNSEPNSAETRTTANSDGVSSADEATTGSAALSPSADMQSSDSSSLPSTNTSVVEYAIDAQKPVASVTPPSCNSNSSMKPSTMRTGLEGGVRN